MRMYLICSKNDLSRIYFWQRRHPRTKSCNLTDSFEVCLFDRPGVFPSDIKLIYTYAQTDKHPFKLDFEAND